MKYDASISATEELAPGILQLTVAVDSPEFRFQAGQWVTLHLPNAVNRAYSIASAPQRPSSIQLAIRVSGGKGSKAIKELKKDDRVIVSGPSGEFLVPSSDDRPLALIGGNTGVAPIRSISLDLAAKNDGRNKLLILDGDGAPDLYVRDFHGIASRKNFYLERGSIESVIPSRAADLKSCRIMICGFQPFIDRARSLLGDAGISLADAIVESFD